MIYIGKFIQQSTKGIIPVRKRNLNPLDTQRKTLTKLLKKAMLTEISFSYDFEKIFKPIAGLSIQEFQKRIPISNYDDYYKLWISRILNGERDIIWPGKIKHFALSSGTTGSPSKRIPISKQMIRSFQLSSISQFNVLFKEDLPLSFYKCQVLTIGGSTQLTKIQNHYEGDLSGILRRHTALIARNLALPGPNITDLKDFQDKMKLMIQEAPNWDVGIIAGIPTWCVKVMEEIVRYYNLKSIHDIWPNLRVYVHGGVYLDPYRKRLENICKEPLILLDTYLASEGYFAYQDNASVKGMKLLINRGIFFEFIPFNKEFFDAYGNLLDRNKALTIDQIEEGVDYAIIISTNSGLWRYILGDLVRFESKKDLRIVISGRIKQTLNLCGEHLTLDNLNQSIAETCQEVNIPHLEYTIISKEDEQYHHWFVENQEGITSEKLMELIDRKISILNDDYQYVRKHALKKPVLTYLPPGTFYEYMKSQNKLGAQNKMPRVMNKEQALKWAEFIRK